MRNTSILEESKSPIQQLDLGLSQRLWPCGMLGLTQLIKKAWVNRTISKVTCRLMGMIVWYMIKAVSNMYPKWLGGFPEKCNRKAMQTMQALTTPIRKAWMNRTTSRVTGKLIGMMVLYKIRQVRKFLSRYMWLSVATKRRKHQVREGQTGGKMLEIKKNV